MIRRTLCLAGLACILYCESAQAQVVQEFVLHQANPHADILPHPLYNAWVPYRKIYNRPRFLGGYLAYKLEPTSQEAMAWDENLHEGNYTHPRKPAHYHLYYYPKPWEALNIEPRPATAVTPIPQPRDPNMQPSPLTEEVPIPKPTVDPVRINRSLHSSSSRTIK